MNASVVVGFGGYPSVPPLLAARGLGARRPATVLHEQNAVLGRANRFLARRADLLALSVADTARVPPGVATRVVGNPVRAAIVARALPPADGVFRLLVLGGSLGARVFSDVVPSALTLLPAAIHPMLRVVQQCRADDLSRVAATYRDAGIDAELSPFFDDVAERLAGAHLVIARAGASTVAELAVVGRPSILVPLPHAIDDHQTANARVLEAAEAACVVAQPDFTPPSLAALLMRILDEPTHIADAAAAARSVAHDDAAGSLADAVEALVAARVR